MVPESEYNFAVFPYLKTTGPVRYRGLVIRSSEDTGDLPPDAIQHLEAIRSLFYLRDGFRIKEMSYAFSEQGIETTAGARFIRELHELRTLMCFIYSSPLPVSARVLDFVDGALEDARLRIGSQVGRSANSVQVLGDAHDTLDWARSLDLKQVVTAYPPTGPAAEAVNDMQKLLSTHGVRLVRLLREWDKAAWPHATHGFFRFRKQIPRIIEAACGSDRLSKVFRTGRHPCDARI